MQLKRQKFSNDNKSAEALCAKGQKIVALALWSFIALLLCIVWTNNTAL
jgi:hypothetical protein